MLPEPVGFKLNRYCPWSELFTPRIFSDAWESVIATVNRSWYLASTLTLPPWNSCLAIRSPLALPVKFTNCANKTEPSSVYSHTRIRSNVSIANDGSGGVAVNVVTAPSRQKDHMQKDNLRQHENFKTNSIEVVYTCIGIVLITSIKSRERFSFSHQKRTIVRWRQLIQILLTESRTLNISFLLPQ